MFARFSWVTICMALGGSLLCQASEQSVVHRSQSYRLHPGDVVTVTYRYSPEYNATAAVQPDGVLNLPLLGNVALGDLTLDEAHTALLAKAGERLNDPEIDVDLKEFEKPYYVVGGEVGNPGKFEIKGPVTALRAIEMAGGFRNSGKASQVWLLRPVDNVTAQSRLINVKAMLDSHNASEDIELRAGDMLIVPKTRIAKSEPYIHLLNPGSFGLYLNPTAF